MSSYCEPLMLGNKLLILILLVRSIFRLKYEVCIFLSHFSNVYFFPALTLKCTGVSQFTATTIIFFLAMRDNPFKSIIKIHSNCGSLIGF